jgi:hypothetical protein
MVKMNKFTLKSIGDLVMTREIRDPVYDYIHLTLAENAVIDSQIFQRLDGLVQMPTAHFVYPSGHYSRKSHSLGVMHLMSKALLHVLYMHSGSLREGISPLLFGEPVVFKERDAALDHLDQKINRWWDSKEIDEIVQYARLTALLHDIGHAPFSHTFEGVTRNLAQHKKIDRAFNHEEMSRKIIEEKEDELGLGEFKANEIKEILDKNGSAPDFLKELIDGPYDCDKLDYLMRDSYHVGASEYGKIDAERIIDGFRVKDLHLCISLSALHAVMSSFHSIQYMYTAVYYHRTSRVFDFMIADALSLVPEFISEIVSEVDTFLKYDDHTIVGEIKERAKRESSSKEYKKAMEILKMVRYRQKKYTCILEFPLSFPLIVKEESQSNIENICTSIKEFSRECNATDFNIRVDYKQAIKPVGINLEDIIEWLKGRRIYDTGDNKVKPLREISRTYFCTLLRYSILFRIFVDREKSRKYPHITEKIKKEARRKLEEFEIEWSTLLLS